MRIAPIRVANFRVGFWQNGFFADFYFWVAGFFRGFCCRIFSPHFCGKKCPEKSSRKIPGKILRNLHHINPRHMSAEGPGQALRIAGPSLDVLHPAANPDPLSLVFGIPYFFAFARKPLLFRVFFPSFPGILGVHLGIKILVFSVVFLAFFHKGKEKKIWERGKGKMGTNKKSDRKHLIK